VKYQPILLMISLCQVILLVTLMILLRILNIFLKGLWYY